MTLNVCQAGHETHEWRPVSRWPNYEICSCGLVRRIAPARGARVGHVLAIAEGTGYQTVQLQATVGVSRSFTEYVHRLVATTFLGPPPDRFHEVNHIDGDRLHPCADNLEWVTRSGNILHSWHVLQERQALRAERGTAAKLTWDQVREIRRRSGTTQRALGEEFGVSHTTIRQIQKGRTWKET